MRHECSTRCHSNLYLDDGRSFTLSSTRLNLTHVYELPLECLRRPFGQQRVLRPCSISLIWRRGAAVIAKGLMRTSLWHVKLEENFEGRLCFLQPFEEHIRDRDGYCAYTGAGPCAVIQAGELKSIVCVVSMLYDLLHAS